MVALDIPANGVPTGINFPTGILLRGILDQIGLTPERIRLARAMLDGSDMDRILSFRDLDVWQLAMDLADSVIADLKAMPRIEFDLKRQIQRAAISIPSNVAEGWRRKKKRLGVSEPCFDRDGIAGRTRHRARDRISKWSSAAREVCKNS